MNAQNNRMNAQNNRELSYIEAVKFTDTLFPPKSQKDYHSDYFPALQQDFEEKVKLFNLGLSEETINTLKKYIEEWFVWTIGYNDELVFGSPLRPQSISAQLFLSHIKFYTVTNISNNSYGMLQQKDGENAFANLGDIEEINEYITKDNIHAYVNEVLSTSIKVKSLIDIKDKAIAQDILLHFGLSPLTDRKNPGYVPDIVRILEKYYREYKDNYIRDGIYTAEQMSVNFNGVVDEITEYVWSTCKYYLDELKEKGYQKKLTSNEMPKL